MTDHSKRDEAELDNKRGAMMLEIKRLHELADREREAAKVMREALEFYAREDFYEYDKTQGINYMWNDQGHKARQALAKADEIRGNE